MHVSMFSNKSKKAEMTVSTLVKLIIAILVLVIITAIVWNFASKGAKSAQGTNDNVIKDTDLTSGYCNIPGVRKCCDASDDKWKTINDKTGYIDCGSNQKCCTSS